MKIDSITRHAITPPAFGSTKIHRAHLVDHIHANIPKKLIAITSPPGYGKTTLLADFTENTELPVAWIRLSDTERDVMRLATVFAASLQRRFRRLRGEPNPETLSGATPDAVARAFAINIDEKVSEAFIVVFDDVQIINRSREVLSFLETWVEVQPEHVTTIMAGREVPEISLAKLMAEGSLAGLGPHDLSLTREEITALAQKHFGVDLSPREAEQLLMETRGWVTGVLLSRILSKTTMSALSQTVGPMVYDYLASVVLNRQPDDMRRFMLDSAVLPVMTAESCDDLLQKDSSNRLLTRMVREGYFVTASSEAPRLYEYHPQFRSFLLETLGNVDPERLRSLRLRAAKYLAKHGTPEHAVELYFDAGTPKRAAKLAEKHASLMFRTGRIQTLKEWAEKLVEDQSAAPKVFLYLAKALTDKGELTEAEEALEKARALLAPNTPKYLHVEIECQLGLIAYKREDYERLSQSSESASRLLPSRAKPMTKAMSLRLNALAHGECMHDHDMAEKLLKEAAEILERSESREDRYALAVILVDLAYFQFDMGKTLESHATSVKAHQIFEELGAPLPLATSFNNLATDAHTHGQYEKALNLFSEGIKFARRAGSPAKETLILLGQADLFNDLGLAMQAAELYGQALRIATQLDSKGTIRYGCLQTSVLHRRRGSGDLPHQWLKRAIELGGEKHQSIDYQIQLAALEMRSVPDQAQKVLTKLITELEGKLNVSQKTLALYFLARSHHLSGDLAKTREMLEKMLTWCGSNGTVQLIAAEYYADQPFWEFSRKQLQGNSVKSMIQHRIDMMKAIAQQYEKVSSEPTSTPSIEVLSLGRVDIISEDAPINDLKPLTREILVYIIDHERVDRDVLLEAFWPEYPPGRQVSNLYTAIYSMRRALGKDSITLDGTIYGMNPDLPIIYDVERFEHAASVADRIPQGDPRRYFALTEAINSYSGGFLPEFSSDWVLERRRGLELRFLELLVAHVDEALIRNQPLRALSSLKRALNLDPYRDDLNHKYLETLGFLERRSEIVAHYQSYVQLLANDLALDPPDSIRSLYEKLIG
jgi:ATP/maltotriose-dependent transcriptional regulator MalT